MSASSAPPPAARNPRAPAADGPRGGGSLHMLVFAGERIEAHSLPAQGSLSLGRAHGNDLCIDHPSVSRRHAILHVSPPLRIEDLGGANGTFLHAPRAVGPGGPTAPLQRISQTSVEIGPGARISLGSVVIVIREGAVRSEGEAAGAAGVVVRSPAMIALFEQARMAARSRLSVLLLGETGVGKEVVARAIHDASPRAARPFLGINCAAFSETLLDAELFGHERGAFTGAQQAKAGLLESADGGTVLLDELGEAPSSIQVKLLRVLEERQVLRIGARTPRPIDVRVVAATHQDLEALIARGTFRRDLYYRVNGMTLTIPPLRERAEEIIPLARAFAARACEELGEAGSAFTDEALALLSRYPWPGNVRELRNAIERAVVLSARVPIGPAHLPPQLRGALDPPSPSLTAPAQPAAAEAPPRKAAAGLDPAERARIVAALEACAWNQTQAAARLGITRRVLIGLIEAHDLPRPRKRG